MGAIKDHRFGLVSLLRLADRAPEIFSRERFVEQNDFESIYERSELAETNFSFAVAGDVVACGQSLFPRNGWARFR